MNADERLRELIHGGPGDRRLWTIMVILAARADDKGIVDIPGSDEIAEWIERSEGWADWSVAELKRQGWLSAFDAVRWDIGRNLRQGNAPRHTSY